MFFDFIVLIVVIGAGYVGFIKGTHVEIYRLGRVFLGMTLAGLFGSSLGWKLTSMGILSANNSAILSLIGFFLVFLMYWLVSIAVLRVIVSLNLSDKKINKYLGTITNSVLALIFITFASFMSTQLTFAKDGYKAYLRDRSFSYIHMDRLCRKVITADVVNEITGEGAGKIIMKNISK